MKANLRASIIKKEKRFQLCLLRSLRLPDWAKAFGDLEKVSTASSKQKNQS